jgi:fucose permease
MVFSMLIIYTPRTCVVFLGHATDLSIWFVVLLGLANSLVWAGIWPLALDGLGKFYKARRFDHDHGIMRATPLFRFFMDGSPISFDTRHAYWVLVPCYLYLLFYAVYGSSVSETGGCGNSEW